MPEFRVWATSEDGALEYISLTEDLLQPAIKAMQESYYLNENLSVAFGLANQPESFPEMDVLLVRAAGDGVSIVARDKVSGKIAGVAINKLERQGTEAADFYDNYVKSCKYSSTRGVVQWMSDFEDMFNIFDYCKVKSLMEVMFLGVVPEFRKRGIAKKLFEVSIEVAKKLKQGENVKVSLDGQQLELGPPPEAVTAICTSFITRKIARDLNSKSALQVDYNKFTHNNKSLGRIIKDTSFLTTEYIKI